MTRIERLGMKLAEAIRLEHDLSVALQGAKELIDALIEQIRFEPDGTLYEMTGEQPLVRPYVDQPLDPDATHVLTVLTTDTVQMAKLER